LADLGVEILPATFNPSGGKFDINQFYKVCTFVVLVLSFR